MAIATQPARSQITSIRDLCALLHSIKFGDEVQDPQRFRMKPQVLTELIQSLALLVENGLSLPVALHTLAREPSLCRYAWMLHGLCRSLEAGRPLSAALAEYPRTFSRLMIGQIRVGEQSGSIVESLNRIGNQLERGGEIRGKIVKRLSYPAMIVLAGTGLVVFMMTVVVPQFESVFAESGTALPWVTRLVSQCSRLLFAWGWFAAVMAVSLGVALRWARRKESFAKATDRLLLSIPVIGNWIRDYAVLQFIDTTGIMMDSGFVPADAISASIDGISNRAVRQVIAELSAAVRRGQKFSDELSRRADMFPPTISQLVIVGEQTGRMSEATHGVRSKLRQQLESRIDTAVTLIEPILTLAMAVSIGFIVMAIYMPMLGMMDVMD